MLNRLTPVMFPTRPTPGPAPVAAAPLAAGGESLGRPPLAEAGASPRLDSGKEPTPGSAAVFGSAVRESLAGAENPRGAGTSSDPGSSGVGLTDCGQPFAHHWHMVGEWECSGVVKHFTLPKPEPWQWPGARRLARDTYNATRTTGPAWPTG